jgi:cyclophilin family peptidyl-prolyl cis-trans isomerase
MAGCGITPQPPSAPLAADAGSNRTAATGETLTLQATATGGTPPYAYQWDIVQVPDNDEAQTIPGGDQAEIQTLPFEVGRYVYRVIVTDADEFTEPAGSNVDFVVIEVSEGLTVSVERDVDVDGYPLPAIVDEPFALSATAAGGSGLAYAWTRVEGVDLEFTNPSSEQTDVIAAEPGEVLIRVTVDDAEGRQVSDEISIVVIDVPRPRVVMTVDSQSEGVSGDVVFELFSDLAPRTVENLLAYIDEGFYDELLWHRVSRNADGSPFVVQTGGFRREDDVLVPVEPLFDPVDSESDNGLSNQPGSIAMALSNNDPDSGTSQFFVNLNDNSFLDEDFTVFGRVVAGMEIIEAMSQVETGTAEVDSGGTLAEVPLDDIVITQFHRTFQTSPLHIEE